MAVRYDATSYQQPVAERESFMRFARIVLFFAFVAAILVSSAAALRFSDDSFNVPIGVVGQPYKHQFNGAGGCGPDPNVPGSGLPYQFSILSGGLPPGLSLSKSGLISGTPTVAGNWSFWVELSDEDPPSAAWCVPEKSQRAFTIDVMPGLFIQQQSLAPTIRGVPYGFQLTAAGGGTQTWSIASGQLPPGITLASSGALSGTPIQTGDFTFVVKVTDGTIRSDTETLTLRVVDELKATAPAQVPPAEASRPLKEPLRLTASGGTAPYTWALAQGITLPDGLTLDPAQGFISGTPTVAGKFPLTLSVSDANRFSASTQVTLDIKAKLAITAKRLSAAKVGRLYSARVPTRGGVAPVKWTIRGKLPLGVRFNTKTGAFVGTPRKAGVFRATVQVKDSLGALSKQTFIITVIP
jgi:hypothetical protein